MSIHIGAKEPLGKEKGDIAKTVLLPGDPLRAKYISEKFLENPFCYNEIRAMYGYTGYYKGKRVSVQGTGMGIPSISIYVNELISNYKVNKLIRIGTCGSFREEIRPRDLILAMSASTDSSINSYIFQGNFASTSNFELLYDAYNYALEKGINTKVGNILTTDKFYNDDIAYWEQWAKYGVLCAEMETAALYSISAKFNVKALSILTVSDSLVTNEQISAKDREKTLNDMIEIALEIS